MTESTLTSRQRFWLDHVQAADTSEGSLSSYAAKHGLSVRSLYTWKSHFSKQSLYSPTKPGNFTPVKITDSAVPSMDPCTPSTRCRITHPSGVCIEFMGDLTSVTLNSIISLAGRER